MNKEGADSLVISGGGEALPQLSTLGQNCKYELRLVWLFISISETELEAVDFRRIVDILQTQVVKWV